MDAATQDDLIRRATERGYLEVRDGRRVVYHGRRQHEENWADPEEKVRAAVFAWLILEREYPANRIDVEVTVPRRTPSDHADIVVYEDDACRVPYLVVENKPRGITKREADQAVEQAFGNANSLRAKYTLYDNADGSRLYDVANFPSTERLSNFLGPRAALGSDYSPAKTFRLTRTLPRSLRALARTLQRAVVSRGGWYVRSASWHWSFATMDPQFLPNGERTAAAPGSALMGREERLIANALSGGRRDVTCSWRAPKMQSVSCTAVSAVNLGIRGGLGLRAAARAVAV